MTDRADIAETIAAQIEPFNKKGIALTEATSFQHDLEWDSLTVMDFVAATSLPAPAGISARRPN